MRSLVNPTPVLSCGSISHWTVRVSASTAQNLCRLTSIIAGNLFKEELVIREWLLVHLHCWRVLENKDLSHFRIPDTVWFSSCLYYKHPATEQVDRTVTAGMEHICVAFLTTHYTHTHHSLDTHREESRTCVPTDTLFPIWCTTLSWGLVKSSALFMEKGDNWGASSGLCLPTFIKAPFLFN